MTAPRRWCASTSARTSRSSGGSSTPKRWPRRTTTASRCASASPTARRPRARSSTTSPTSANGCCAATASPATSRRTRRGARGTRTIARQRVHGTHGELVAERAERDRAALLALPASELPGRPAHDPGPRARRVLQLRGPPLPGPSTPGRVSGSSSCSAPPSSRSTRLVDGRRLARHERGRPARVLPDPVENSVSLASVLGALPTPEVHRRPLSVYQELIDG